MNGGRRLFSISFMHMNLGVGTYYRKLQIHEGKDHIKRGNHDLICNFVCNCATHNYSKLRLLLSILLAMRI